MVDSEQVKRFALIGSCGLAAFSLLLLIISVGIPTWLVDDKSNSVGLFRKCYSDDSKVYSPSGDSGCFNENQTTQGGLSVFGLLLLAFAVIAGVAAIYTDRSMLLLATLVLLYFSSMFVMSAYATWGTYARDPKLNAFPIPADSNAHHTSMGPGYHLCVAAHYFLWTALTIFAFGVGAAFAAPSGST